MSALDDIGDVDDYSGETDSQGRSSPAPSIDEWSNNLKINEIPEQESEVTEEMMQQYRDLSLTDSTINENEEEKLIQQSQNVDSQFHTFDHKKKTQGEKLHEIDSSMSSPQKESKQAEEKDDNGGELLSPTPNTTSPLVSPNLKNRQGSTSLHLVASTGSALGVELMLQHGADVLVQDASGRTALHIAASSIMGEPSSVVHKLLEAGSDPNIQDQDGSTPLHNAAASGQHQSVQYLINFGALSVSNKVGDTPLHLAALGSFLEVMQLLILGPVDCPQVPTNRLNSLSSPLAAASSVAPQPTSSLSSVVSSEDEPIIELKEEPNQTTSLESLPNKKEEFIENKKEHTKKTFKSAVVQVIENGRAVSVQSELAAKLARQRTLTAEPVREHDEDTQIDEARKVNNTESKSCRTENKTNIQLDFSDELSENSHSSKISELDELRNEVEAPLLGEELVDSSITTTLSHDIVDNEVEAPLLGEELVDSSIKPTLSQDMVDNEVLRPSSPLFSPSSEILATSPEHSHITSPVSRIFDQSHSGDLSYSSDNSGQFVSSKEAARAFFGKVSSDQNDYLSYSSDSTEPPWEEQSPLDEPSMEEVYDEQGVWTKYWTEDGDAYYYHSGTGTSKWEEPWGDNIVILEGTTDSGSTVYNGQKVDDETGTDQYDENGEYIGDTTVYNDETDAGQYDENGDYIGDTTVYNDDNHVESVESSQHEINQSEKPQSEEKETVPDESVDISETASDVTSMSEVTAKSSLHSSGVQEEPDSSLRSLEIWNKFFENALTSNQAQVSIPRTDNAAFLKAVISGRVEEVEKLVVLGAIVSCRDEQNRTPLHYAAYNGDRDMLSLLCDYDADIEACDASGNTALHVSAARDSTKTLTFLLEYAAQVNAQNDVGDTPLHLAVWFGNYESVKMLIEYSAPVNMLNTHGLNPYFNVMKRSPLVKKQKLPSGLKRSLNLLAKLMPSDHFEEESQTTQTKTMTTQQRGASDEFHDCADDNDDEPPKTPVHSRFVGLHKQQQQQTPLPYPPSPSSYSGDGGGGGGGVLTPPPDVLRAMQHAKLSPDRMGRVAPPPDVQNALAAVKRNQPSRQIQSSESPSPRRGLTGFLYQ